VAANATAASFTCENILVCDEKANEISEIAFSNGKPNRTASALAIEQKAFHRALSRVGLARKQAESHQSGGNSGGQKGQTLV
jgi:hypothetical protein